MADECREILDCFRNFVGIKSLFLVVKNLTTQITNGFFPFSGCSIENRVAGSIALEPTKAKRPFSFLEELNPTSDHCFCARPETQLADKRKIMTKRIAQTYLSTDIFRVVNSYSGD